MNRYVIRPRAYWGEDAWAELDTAEQPTINVLEDDRYVDTGLLDADGNPLLRVVGIPCGFVRSRT